MWFVLLWWKPHCLIASCATFQDGNKTPIKQHNYNIHPPSPPGDHSNNSASHDVNTCNIAENHDVVFGNGTNRDVSENRDILLRHESRDALGLTEDEYTTKFLPGLSIDAIQPEIPELICHWSLRNNRVTIYCWRYSRTSASRSLFWVVTSLSKLNILMRSDTGLFEQCDSSDTDLPKKWGNWRVSRFQC